MDSLPNGTRILLKLLDLKLDFQVVQVGVSNSVGMQEAKMCVCLFFVAFSGSLRIKTTKNHVLRFVYYKQIKQSLHTRTHIT